MDLIFCSLVLTVRYQRIFCSMRKLRAVQLIFWTTVPDPTGSKQTCVWNDGLSIFCGRLSYIIYGGISTKRYSHPDHPLGSRSKYSQSSLLATDIYPRLGLVAVLGGTNVVIRMIGDQNNQPGSTWNIGCVVECWWCRRQSERAGNRVKEKKRRGRGIIWFAS